MKKLHISLVFSNLVVLKPLVTKLTYMRNFTVKFYKILEICKQFAGNRVNVESTSNCKINQLI